MGVTESQQAANMHQTTTCPDYPIGFEMCSHFWVMNVYPAWEIPTDRAEYLVPMPSDTNPSLPVGPELAKQE